MNVSVILADRGTANPPAGTLNLLNAGWSVTTLQPAPGAGGPFAPGGTLTPPHTVAAFYEVDYQHCNHPIDFVLELLSEDGLPVHLPGPDGPQPMRMQRSITVASPGGLPVGTPGTGNTMLEVFPGLPLGPGAYIWRVTLAGEHRDGWETRFDVQAAPPTPQAQFGAPGPQP